MRYVFPGVVFTPRESFLLMFNSLDLPSPTEPTPKASRSKIGFLWFTSEAEAQAVVAAHAAAPFTLGKYNIVVKADSGASKKRPPGIERLNMGLPHSSACSSSRHTSLVWLQLSFLTDFSLDQSPVPFTQSDTYA